MGAGLSLPDGSELKAPEERIAHDVNVRANMALVFVKPHAYQPDAIEFVKNELVKAGLMNWSDLMRPNPAKGSEGHVDGVEPGDPVIDPTKLAALQSKLSTAAQRQANDLARVQQVVERRRTTPGAVPASAGALYPGLKVWMPPAFAPPEPSSPQKPMRGRGQRSTLSLGWD